MWKILSLKLKIFWLTQKLPKKNLVKLGSSVDPASDLNQNDKCGNRIHHNVNCTS